jgi:hypothetical protein
VITSNRKNRKKVKIGNLREIEDSRGYLKVVTDFLECSKMADDGQR